MNKYLSPYITSTVSNLYKYRKSLLGSHEFGYSKSYKDGWGLCSWDARFWQGKYFNTEQEAKKYLDEYLIDKGYVFLTEKQFSKLKILL